MSDALITVSLLSLLKREDEALLRERCHENYLMEARQKIEECVNSDDIVGITYYKKDADYHTEQRDAALAELWEVRNQIKLYIKHL